MLKLIRTAGYFVKSIRDYVEGENNNYCNDTRCMEERKKNPVLKMAEIYNKKCKKYKGKQVLE